MTATRKYLIDLNGISLTKEEVIAEFRKNNTCIPARKHGCIITIDDDKNYGEPVKINNDVLLYFIKKG